MSILSLLDPNQTPHYVASDLELHCLPRALFLVSRQEWVKSTRLYSLDTKKKPTLLCF